MGLFLYNVILTLLYPVYFLLQFLHPRGKHFFRSRKEGKKQIQHFLNQYKNQKKIWLHASSMGELDQALALVRYIKKIHPELPILITVFSLSVKDFSSKLSHIEGKAYLPIDFFWQWNLKNFQVDAFITFTWDTFPNLLKKLKKQYCKNFLCSAAIKKDSYRIRYSFLFQFFYTYFDGIGVVDKQNQKYFRKLISDHKIHITGDTRYETIFYKLSHIKISKEIQKKLQLANNILILASTYKTCDRELYPGLSSFFQIFPEQKIWIFPHHIDSERIRETISLLEKYGHQYLLFSNPDFFHLYQKYNIIIVDQLGILAYAYQYSNICYVGGGFHHRVHNTGEPAACGTIPFTGPHIETSPVALLLYHNQLLFRCHSGEEIWQNIIRLYQNPYELKKKSKETKELLKSQLGASENFYRAFLSPIVSSPTSNKDNIKNIK